MHSRNPTTLSRENISDNTIFLKEPLRLAKFIIIYKLNSLFIAYLKAKGPTYRQLSI